MSLEDKHIQDVSARKEYLQRHGISSEMYDYMISTSIRIANVLGISPEDVLMEHTPIVRKLSGRKIKIHADKEKMRRIAGKIIEDHTSGKQVNIILPTPDGNLGDITAIRQEGNRLLFGSTELAYDPDKKSLERHLSIRGKVSPTSNTLKSELRELLKKAKESFPEATAFVSNTWINGVPQLVPWYDMYSQYEGEFGENPLQDSEHDMQSLSSWGQIVHAGGALRATIADKISANVEQLGSVEDIKNILPTARKSVAIPLEFVYRYFGVM